MAVCASSWGSLLDVEIALPLGRSQQPHSGAGVLHVGSAEEEKGEKRLDIGAYK